MSDENEATLSRLHRSWLAEREKSLLIWLARHMPAKITSDKLTVLGLAGAVICGLSYAMSGQSRLLLPLACIGLLINWFGDSLDGTLARLRGLERKRYGFFVDHSVDVVAQVFVFIGLGLSPLMRLDNACLLLLGYWMATLLTLIRAVVTKQFHVSYYGVGPTEIRIALVLYTLAEWGLGPLSLTTSFGSFSLIDLASLPIFLVVFTLFLSLTWSESRRLSVEDRPRPPPG